MMMLDEFDIRTQSDMVLPNIDMYCIACGDKIEENSYSCKCGHVHETERKLIKGKRYSVYREHLYSKLILQELEQDHDRKSQSPKQKQKTLSDSIQIQKKPFKKRPRKSKLPKRSKKQYGGDPRHAYGTTLPAVDHSEKNCNKNYENFYPTSWNFEFALEDINRRLLKQSLFWVRL